MNKKTLTFIFSCAAIIAANAHDADFSVTATEVTDALLAAAPWTKPTDGTAAKDGDYISVDADILDPLKYTAANSGTKAARFSNTVVISGSESMPASPSDTAQGAIACVTNTTSGCLEWYCWVKVGDAAVAWTKFETDDNLHPKEGETWDILFETQESNGVHTVRYSVKNVTANATGYTVLKQGDVEWFANPLTTVTVISNVCFAGVAKFSDFSGKYLAENASYQKITGSSSVDTVVVSNSWIGAYVLSGESINSTPTADPETGRKSNGMSYWKSYVLGLNPTNDTSKPIVKSVQDTESGKLTFSIGNVNYNSSSGVAVKYCVKTYNNLNDASAADTSSEAAIGTNISIGVPSSNSAVRYYKIEYNFSDAE